MTLLNTGDFFVMSVKISASGEIRNDLLYFFREKSIVPIVGSGISAGLEAYRGKIPTGREYLAHMTEAITTNGELTDDEKSTLAHESFSRISDYYQNDDVVPADIRRKYLRDNFSGAEFPDEDPRKKFFEINWPYIYSLNLDDAIENSTQYKKVIRPDEEIFDDVFTESKCIIKLHGDISEILTYRNAAKILSAGEYIRSLKDNFSLLAKLENDYCSQNILYIGCSLDDEIDLRSAIRTEKDRMSRVIIFVRGTPSKLTRTKYEQFGITDIVCFDEYDDMYTFLYDAWQDSQKVHDDELEEYLKKFRVCDLSSADVDANREYFFMGRRLFSSDECRLTFPAYFIRRSIMSEVISNMKLCRVHLVFGGRFSGKTYFLAGLKREVRDRGVYYFDGSAKLSSPALQKLIAEKNIAVLLDVGAITRGQFEHIIDSAKEIHGNGNNFVVCVSRNDSDSYGICKMKILNSTISSSDIMKYDITGTIPVRNEADDLNAKYALVKIPAYSYMPDKRNFLDHVFYAGEALGVRAELYRHIHISADTTEDLALLIMLAAEESLTTLKIKAMRLDGAVNNALERYKDSPVIDFERTLDLEKSGADTSRRKYVLNSKYWLRHELGEYASSKSHEAKIVDAYHYIIEHITTNYKGRDLWKVREKFRKYILFDVINDVFLRRKGGSIRIIAAVYRGLHDLLATDHQYLHQYAKCMLLYSGEFPIGSGEQTEKLHEAGEYASLSRAKIESDYEYGGKKNKKLEISLAHVNYTIAAINSALCISENYGNAKRISDTVNDIHEALLSPFNDDYSAIREFVNYVSGNNILEADQEKILSDILKILVESKGYDK